MICCCSSRANDAGSNLKIESFIKEYQVSDLESENNSPYPNKRPPLKVNKNKFNK